MAATASATAGAGAADDPQLDEYGTDADEIRRLVVADERLGERIDRELPYTFAQAAFAVKAEMARTLEDVLSRRTRALLLDREAALRAAPAVSALLRREMGEDEAWETRQLREFRALAEGSYGVEGR